MDPAKTVLSVTVKAKTLKQLQERLQYYVKDNGFGFAWEYTDVFVKAK